MVLADLVFREMNLLGWGIFFGVLAVIIIIGLSFTQKAGKNLTSFFLGGRNLPWYIAGVSMVATTFAADTPLAVTELVAKNGISGNWLWWNMLAGGMLTTFFFANLWRRAEVLTEVELIELRYDGIGAAFLRGFKALYLGIFMNVLVIGWVNLALMTILESFFGLSHFDAFMYTALTMLIVALYASLTGLIGIVITDSLQFLVAMIGCIVLAVTVVSHGDIGGIAGLKEKIPEGALNFFPTIGEGGSDVGSVLAVSFGAFFAYIGIQWWASWYPGAEPGGGGYVAQRMMSAKNEKHAVYATLFFQIAHYCIRPWPWIIVALCVLVLFPELQGDDAKQGFVKTIKLLHPAWQGFLLSGFFAAYMSTISTQLNWGASYVVNDFYYRFLEPTATQKRLVLVARITTIILMIIGLIVSYFITSISGVWTFIIECGAGLGLVLILRWYWWRINAWSEIAATISPFAFYAFSKFILKWEFPNSFFLTVGFTTLTWIIVTYFTPPTKMEKLKAFYTKVQPDGRWGAVRQLTNLVDKKSNLVSLFICWISAVLMTYSILFASGKLVFMEWQSAIIWIVTALVSFVILKISLAKTKILGD